MSPAASVDSRVSGMRSVFIDELDQLQLQVELMALRVDRSIELAIRVLERGDVDAAAELLATDDEIDSMHVSLTERCYELLVRFHPMASDLRLVVSVMKVLGALERIGNLCLRIANLVEDQPLLSSHPAVFTVIRDLAENVHERFRVVQRGWSSRDIRALAPLERSDSLEHFAAPLVGRILELDGPDAVRVAMTAFVAGRSLDRIGDHTTVMAVRLQYLVTGDPIHLAREVGT